MLLQSALELVIGLCCACLPSINLLIQSHSSTRHLSPPNMPRTFGSEIKKKANPFIKWSFKTSKTSQTLSLRGDPTDAELGIALDSEVVFKSESNASWGYNPRATSVDGHREGWLLQAKASVMKTEIGILPTQTCAGLEARRSWEAAWNRSLP